MQRLLKLKKMSADEVRVRVAGELRRRRERRLWRRSARGLFDAPKGSDEQRVTADTGLLAAAAQLVPGMSPAEIARLRAGRPDAAAEMTARAVEHAQAILSGTWEMLGHGFDLTGRIAWHRDPRSEHHWERTFYGDLPLSDLAARWDVKYVWELGRMQWLVPLATAWLLGSGEGNAAEDGRRWMKGGAAGSSSLDLSALPSAKNEEQSTIIEPSTLPEQAAARVREVFLDWIEHNRLYEGIHWTSGLEVAMRSISWLWSLAALAEWDGWTAGDLTKITASLAEHASYLEHHFSFYSSPYNHLIGEATALYLVGLTLDGEPAAGRWRERALEVLLEHGPKQFYADGFCVEQATGYHFYTLGFLSLAIAAARGMEARIEDVAAGALSLDLGAWQSTEHEGQSTDSVVTGSPAHRLTRSSSAGCHPLVELEPVIRRAYRAGAAFRQPDGRWARIGDVDSARAIPVAPEDFWGFRSVCALGAVLFNDGELKGMLEDGAAGTLSLDLSSLPGTTTNEQGTNSGSLPSTKHKEQSTKAAAELYWLLGCDGLDRWEALKPEPVPSGVLLPAAGYAIARGGGDWLLFDAGPIADGLHADATPSVAHGHADALQVVYVSGGRLLLRDSGMPFYSGPDEWPLHFRGPAAHNTIEIEDAPMAQPVGRLGWSHVAAPPQLAADLSVEAWLARGHAVWAPGVIVERYVLAVPGDGLWVADWIRTGGPRTVRWHWQLPPLAVRAVRSAGTARLAKGEGVSLVAWCDEPLTLTLDEPGGAAPDAWDAPEYGILRPAQCVRCTQQVVGESLVVTYIGPVPREVDVTLRGRHLHGRLKNGNGAKRNGAAADRSVESPGIQWRVKTSTGWREFAMTE